MPRLLVSGRTFIPMVLLVFAVPSLAGCFLPAGRTDPKELRHEAAALIPTGSRVIKQADSDCVEFESSPSCHLIYFVSPLRSTAVLTGEVQKAASEDGWSLARKDVYSGGTELRLKRDGLRAYVSVAAGARVDACRREPREGCASFINVSVD